MSFYMPSDSGEKVTLGITTLLSMTVFLMVSIRRKEWENCIRYTIDFLLTRGIGMFKKGRGKS